MEKHLILDLILKSEIDVLELIKKLVKIIIFQKLNLKIKVINYMNLNS